MRDSLSVVGMLCLLLLGFFIVIDGGYQLTAYFAPKYEAIRRDVMIQSRAYTEGENRNLSRLLIEYQQAPTPEAKNTILAAARHECEAVDRTRLPIELANFCNPFSNYP